MLEPHLLFSNSQNFASIRLTYSYKSEIIKFSGLANTRLSTYCPTDTITNQDIKANLHSVKTEYKFLHLPHNCPSSFQPRKWPDSCDHYSIAVKVPLRVASDISLDECLPENSSRGEFPNTKFTHGKIHTRAITDEAIFLLLLRLQFMQLMASVYTGVCENS